ncbi:MAG: biotin--[acetyl-CoA-carboxylase] ligase [Phycisphaeraceae bacterium]|nr:biotin--[acetyl-CoA-carboxylase] ligase [Phycisphaeraceae bacterium]
MDLQHLVKDGLVAGVTYHDQLPSTNDLALQLGKQMDLPLPHLVLTDCQTAGRGRGINPWWWATGALTFSLIVDSAKWQWDETDLPKLPLAVGVAVCDAVQQGLPDATVGLKWPNDVWLNGRKVAGILVERIELAGEDGGTLSTGRLVIGVGVNVNNRWDQAPTEIRGLGTSMAQAIDSQRNPSSEKTAETFDQQSVLRAVLQACWSWFAQVKVSSGGLDVTTGTAQVNSANIGSGSTLHERLKVLCVLTGRQVVVKQAQTQIHGYCEGIGTQGQLLLRTATGLYGCTGGVVEAIK